MFPGSPAQNQIIGKSLTATGNLATVPAGMTLTANIQLAGTIALLGTCDPRVTVNGTNAAPAAGTVVARLIIQGIGVTASSADSNSFEVLVKAPPENAVTLDFTQGAAGSSSATISGWYFS